MDLSKPPPYPYCDALGCFRHGMYDGKCPEHRIAELEAKLKVKYDTSELHQEIAELRLESRQRGKQIKHREKIWKKRVAELKEQRRNLLDEKPCPHERAKELLGEEK